MEQLKPTYLCIKQHSVTGLQYFCKTTKSYEEMLRYSGSGKPYWNNHLKMHGRKYVKTIWFCLFYDKEEIEKFALMCSEQWNIVNAKDENGKKIWANLREENGLSGAVRGIKVGPHTEKRKKNISIGRTSKENIAWNKGIQWSEKTKVNMRKPKVKATCPHCLKIGGANNMYRYYFDNCKQRSILL